MKNANTIVERVDAMLSTELFVCNNKNVAVVSFSFVSNTTAKLQIETQVADLCVHFIEFYFESG